MSDFPQCVDCARVNVETHGGRCWSCDRNAARAEGVAAERARVVAWLRAADSETLVWFAAQRIEQGWHDKEGE